jgi:hypothetical protein
MEKKLFQAQQNLPFDIKKGDILTFIDNKILINSNGSNIPLNPLKESEFFKEYVEIKLPFSKNADVVLKKVGDFKIRDSYKKATLPAWTPFKFQDVFEKNKKTICIVRYQDKSYEIDSKLLVESHLYYFINSSGVVHKAFSNRDIAVDVYRIKSENYFTTKEEAVEKLNSILSKPFQH